MQVRFYVCWSAVRPLLAITLLLAGAVRAEPQLEWNHEGYPSLVEAAQAAKRKARRLLIGLSGSDT
ncbi:MAG: hypothetical protein ACYSX0_09020 [Planctomycetota bacterium]|jgi:hypothetical protein